MDVSGSFAPAANFFASIPTDWLLIGAFAVLVTFDTLKNGARRSCTVALALPIAAFLAGALPQSEIVGPLYVQSSTPIFTVGLFAALFIATYALISRFGLSWGDDAGQALHAALAGVAATAIVITMWIATPSLDGLWHFGSQVQNIFGEGYRFFWIFASYAVLAFVRNS